MKKLMILIVFIIAVIIFNNKDNEIRVRIIANSNNKEDIEIKEKIKLEVIEFLDSIDGDITDYINNNINDLETELNKIEKCSVTFENHIFMNKAYNDISIDNGEYLTLLIKINEAKGDNWWTTLYPINDLDPTTIKYKSWILERVNEK